MALKFEELRVLQTAESIADEIWHQILRWDDFAKNVVGKQLVRATDSVGANIAEAFGWFHYGEKLRFLYYASCSLFEAKYWLNRALERDLMTTDDVGNYVSELTELARQLNTFAGMIKSQCASWKSPQKGVRENKVDYVVEEGSPDSKSLFSDDDYVWLKSLHNI
jgi:four helix bundle protein